MQQPASRGLPIVLDLYSRDTWQLIHAGLQGGHHDIPATVTDHPQVFLTPTAPSFGAVHTVSAAGGCHPRGARNRECRHGKPMWCDRSHSRTDAELGQPLCGECYDYIGHVSFSWHAPELWRRFTIRVRRRLLRELRDRGEQPGQTRISLMKVVELQRRALPHFHAVIRLDVASEPGTPPAAPDTTVSAQDLVEIVHQAATETALALPGDKTMRFGDQIDIKVITTPSENNGDDRQTSGRKIAAYLAKYVTKSVADFGIAVRRLSTAAIDQLDVTDHIRKILRTIVRISAEAGYTEIISWIHALGYRGHVVSKSRQFSTTMTALRERRRAWRKSQIHDFPGPNCPKPNPAADLAIPPRGPHQPRGPCARRVGVRPGSRTALRRAKCLGRKSVRTMNSADFGVELCHQHPYEGHIAPNSTLLLTIPEAAARLRISRSSIYRLFDAGELRWVRVCASRRVSTAEINRFIAEHTQAAS